MSNRICEEITVYSGDTAPCWHFHVTGNGLPSLVIPAGYDRDMLPRQLLLGLLFWYYIQVSRKCLLPKTKCPMVTWHNWVGTRSGARLTKNYSVTIQRYRNSHAKIEENKIHILRCMGSKFCVKFQRARTKFWTHAPQNMHFTRC